MSGFVRIIVLLAPSFLIGVANALGLECSSKTAETLIIALDVGHVPKIPGHECVLFIPCYFGATSARGVTEYEFNIKLATSIKEELIRTGFRSTHLMVPAPNTSLQMRVGRAIALKADLFISIHHDSVRDEFLEPWTFDGRKNWYFDDSSGFSLHVSTRNVKYSESLGLARAIADQLIANGLHFSTAHDPKNLFGARKPYIDASRGIYRRDALHVLTRAKMPAVLLEGGTIVNREEELEVSTPAYRSRIATSVAMAIRSFCGYAASAATDRVIDDVPNMHSGPDSNRATIAVNSSVEIGAELPAGFVYLSEVAPTVRQDIRYAGSHNFTGRPVDGYQANECILTMRAADALQHVQAELAGKNLSLLVWDCYRPLRAVRDFINWSRSRQRPLMKAEFFPRTNKNEFFARGYLSSHSAHARGSTVDLGIVPSAVRAPPTFDAAIPLVPCTAPKGVRFDDGTIDFGTGYDCLDALARTNNPDVSKEAHLNRILLQHVMRQHGFRPYSREWWHFKLSDDPFPGRSFDFPIVARKTAQAKAVR